MHTRLQRDRLSSVGSKYVQDSPTITHTHQYACTSFGGEAWQALLALFFMSPSNNLAIMK